MAILNLTKLNMLGEKRHQSHLHRDITTGPASTIVSCIININDKIKQDIVFKQRNHIHLIDTKPSDPDNNWIILARIYQHILKQCHLYY